MAASIQIGKGELILAAGAALLALYIYNDAKKAAAAIGNKAASAAGYVADKVNPIKQENVVNSVIESTGQAISTNKDWTLGGWLYDLTAPDTSQNPSYQSGKLNTKPVTPAGAKR